MRRISTTVLLATALATGCAHRQPAPAAAPGSGERFATPKAALDAVLAACRGGDEARLLAIFGKEAQPLVATGDAATDRERCQRFDAAAQRMTRFDPKGPDTLQLVLGTDDWPFPIPLVKDGSGWRFDTAAGAREIRRRRVGANELEAITACRTYVLAQQEQAAHKRPYAQELVGGRGAAALAWPPRDVAAPGAGVQPGPTPGTATWRGYVYRVLTAQGAAGPGGTRSWIAKGRLTGGFGLVAWPAAYGASGIMTFLVGPDGSVRQQDLGKDTATRAAAITSWDPGPGWTVVPR